MKTRFTSICALVYMVLFFSACQKDSLNHSLSPEYTKEYSTDSHSSADDLEFKMWQQVDIIQPACPLEQVIVSDVMENDDEISKTSGCNGIYGLTSYEGQGWISEYGRFLSYVDLKFDPQTNEVTGLISLMFQGDNDMLILKAMGDIKKDDSSDDGFSLAVQVLSQKGTGRFAYVHFNGLLKIMRADQIFDGEAIDYKATIYINGSFGK